MKNTEENTPELLNIAELAARLGRDRGTIAKYLEGLEPVRITGKARYYNAGEAIAAIEDAIGKSAPSSLREELLRERIRKLKIENDKRMNELIPLSDFQATINDMASGVQSVLAQIPGRLSPDLAGLSIPDIEQRLNTAINEALMHIRYNGELPIENRVPTGIPPQA